jgi:hypothetical protein
MKVEVPELQTDLTQDAVRSVTVFTRRDLLLYSICSGLRLAALCWFLIYWSTPVRWWRSEKLALLCASVLLLIALAGNHLRWASLAFMKRPIPMTARHEHRVAVVTTCVPDLETTEMLTATLKALVSLDCPHDTWLLDEGDSALMRDACRSLGVLHFTRRGLPQYQTEGGQFAAATKHGNYNAWLNEIGFRNYDILIAFDPDHIPASDYASSVLGFFEDPHIAFVQVPQVYRNQSASLVARGAAEETYGYYSATEMSSHGLGETVLVGCHSAQRLSALQPFGGFPDHPAEDLLQTICYRSEGWRGVYLPQVLATGLAPEGWSEYLTQQVRWARSVFDIKVRHILPRQTSLSWAALTELLQGFGYLQDALIAAGVLVLLFPLLTVGIGLKTFQHLFSVPFAVLLATMFVTDFFRQRFYLLPKVERGIHWRAGVLRLAKWPFLWKGFWLAVSEKRFPYDVTPKVRSRPVKLRLLLPHGTVAAAIGVAWAVGVMSEKTHDTALHMLAAGIMGVSLGLILLETASGHGID